MRRTGFCVLLSLAFAISPSAADAKKKKTATAEAPPDLETAAPAPAQAAVLAPGTPQAPGVSVQGQATVAQPGVTGQPAGQPAFTGQPAGQQLPPGVVPPGMPGQPSASGEPAPAGASSGSASGHSTPWKVAVAGAGILGGSYVLSLIVGSMSYAGYTSGQAGWFAPVVGPALAMGSVGGDAGGCYSKAAFTYTLGPMLSLFTLAGIGTTIGGVISMFTGAGKAASGAVASLPPVRVTPSLTPGGAGMVVLGEF